MMIRVLPPPDPTFSLSLLLLLTSIYRRIIAISINCLDVSHLSLSPFRRAALFSPKWRSLCGSGSSCHPSEQPEYRAEGRSFAHDLIGLPNCKWMQGKKFHCSVQPTKNSGARAAAATVMGTRSWSNIHLTAAAAQCQREEGRRE